MRYFSLIFFLAFLSCQKEPTTWEHHLKAPLAYGHLDFNNLIQKDVLSANNDGTLQMVWQKDLIVLNIDSLANIPDTTITKNFAIGVSSLTANPGFEFIDDVQNFSINDADVELKEVLLEEGKVALSMESPLSEATIVEVLLPAASKDNIPFSKTYEVTAGSANNPTIIKDTVDFSGYKLDLTGSNGNLVNNMQIQFKVSVAPDGNTVTITDQDVIKMQASFIDLLPYYARGYFGQHTFNEQENIPVELLNNVAGGTIDIDNINFDLIIENSFDIVARGKVNGIASENINQNNTVSLQHPEFQQWININPAQGSWNSLQPYQKTFNFNSNNSNIEAFLENLPQNLWIDFEGEINPLGNTTGGHDEMFPQSKLALRLEADFPIRLAANQFAFSDTVDITFNNDNGTFEVLAGELVIDGTNNMPFGAQIQLEIYDTVNQESFSIPVQGNVPPPILNSNNKIVNAETFSVMAELSEERLTQLNQYQKLIFTVYFNTSGSGTIPFYEDYYFDYKVKANINSQISY